MAVANQVSTGNFSFSYIPSDVQITIGSGQQMLVNESIKIDGEVIVEESGEIVCLTSN